MEHQVSRTKLLGPVSRTALAVKHSMYAMEADRNNQVNPGKWVIGSLFGEEDGGEIFSAATRSTTSAHEQTR